MYSSILSLTSEPDGVDGQRPGRFTPAKRLGTHCTRGWVGPRAGLDGSGKSHSPPGFDPRTDQPAASRYMSYPGAQTSLGYLQNSTLATSGCLGGPVTLRSHVRFVLREIADGKESG